MSTIRWQPVADATAQVSTVQITGYDATTTYKVTIGGVVISTVGTGGTASTTASALKVLLAASTHPYFTAITFSVATDTITMTANEAGVPFVATSSVTGGAGTIGSVTAVTANTGPNVYIAANFSGGVLPANGDTLIFENSSTSCLWGLDQSAVTLAELRVMQSYTGLLGLDPTRFVTEITENTGSTSETYTTGKIDYRDDYLKIGATLCNIGQGAGSGSPRLKVNFGTVQTACTVYNTRGSGIDANLQPCRLLGTHVSNALTVHGGNVGVATSTGSEVSTLSLYYQTGGTVLLDSGVTWTTATKSGGTLNMRSSGSSGALSDSGGDSTITLSSGTVATVTSYGGTINLVGTISVTTLNSIGGVINYDAAGTATSAGVNNGGVLNLGRTRFAKTLTNFAIGVGGGRLLVNDQSGFANNISGGPSGSVPFSLEYVKL